MGKSDINRKGNLYLRIDRYRRDHLKNTFKHIDSDNHREEYTSKDKTDTIMRKDIHTTIIKMLGAQKGKIEILAELNNKYPDTKLAKYFEQWIDYHIEKGDFTIESETIKDTGDER